MNAAGQLALPLDSPKPRQAEGPDALRARFLAKLAVDGAGCWIWLAHRTPNGYGHFRIGGRWVGAHRAAVLIFRGPIADGLHVDHLCRVRQCVNPDHLELVTPRTNTLRGVSPTARAHIAGVCVRGHALTGTNIKREGSRIRCRTCRRNQASRHINERGA